MFLLQHTFLPASNLLTSATTSLQPALTPSKSTALSSQPTSPSLCSLRSSLSSLPFGWYDLLRNDEIQLCKLVFQEKVPTQIHISQCIVVEADLSWRVFVNSHLVERETSTILSSFPHFLDHGTVMKLISNLESACICHGYPRKEFVDMVNTRGGVIGGVNGEVRALVDSLHPVAMNGEIYRSTIRTTRCTLLSNSSLCSQCRNYGSVLRRIHSQWIRRPRDHFNKFTNNHYLTPSQKRHQAERPAGQSA